MRKTIDNRQSDAMNSSEKLVGSFFRKRCKCLPWILCAGGVAGTTHNEIQKETARGNDLKDLVLESSTNSGGSTNHDAGTAYWILSRGR